MTPELEQFLKAIRQHLGLSDSQAEPIMAELRLHVQSDFEERLRLGLSEAEAAQETMREFGDTRAVARELQEEHKFEPKGKAMLRNIGTGLLAVVWFFTIQGFYRVGSLIYSLEQFFPRTAKGVLVTGWLQPLYEGLWWMGRHLSDGQQLILLQAIPLVALGLLVGAITRKRYWLLAFVPWLLFWSRIWQPLSAPLPIHVVEPVAQALFILLGVYLGRQSAHWRLGLRRVLLGLSSLMMAAIWTWLLYENLAGYSIVAVFMLGFAGVAVLAVWGALRLMRRGNKLQPTGLAE